MTPSVYASVEKFTYWATVSLRKRAGKGFIVPTSVTSDMEPQTYSNTRTVPEPTLGTTSDKPEQTTRSSTEACKLW